MYVEHYHIYRPFVFPEGSERVERYELVAQWFDSRSTASRYARSYDVGPVRAMVRQCWDPYCALEAEYEYAADS